MSASSTSILPVLRLSRALAFGGAALYMLALCPLISGAQAQLTSLSNPEILERALKDPAPAKPRATDSLTLPALTAPPEGADDISFVLSALSIKGGDSFDVETITGLNPPQTGAKVTLADLYGFADRITQFYREQGYALSFALVPAQEVTDGRVTIEIIEGQIDELIIRERNLSDLARQHILDAFGRFAAKGLTKTDDLEGFLLSLNDYAGISAKGVIRPGTEPSGAALVLEVEQTRQIASTGYQNYLSDSLGRDVFLADIAWLGQWTGRDEARLSLRQAPDPRVYQSVGFDYSTYLDDSDLEVFVSISQSETQPKKGTLADIKFSSSSYVQEFGLRLPIWQTRKSSLFAGGSLRLSNAQSRSSGAVSSTDQVRYITGYADYEVDLAGGASHQLHVELEQGAKLFQSRADSREGANLHHSILRIKERYRQPIIGLPIGQVDATIRLMAQATLSDDPLFANAECSFGGRGYGIGLDAGTLSGENCLLGSIQLNWQRPLIGFALLPPSLFTLLGRIDAGVVKQAGTLTAGEERQQEAISAAIGGQFVMTSGMTVNIEQATQLKNEDSPQDEGETMTNISVNMRF